MLTRSPASSPKALLHRAARLIRHPIGIFHAARVAATWGRSDAEHVFILGIPRSGNTLLATVLGSEGRLATAGDETHFFLLRNYGYMSPRGLEPALWQRMICESQSRADLFDRLASNYILNQSGAERFLEKTPVHALVLDKLAATFPNARFVFCIREPRDAYASLKRGKDLPDPSIERYVSDYVRSCEQYLNADRDRCHLVQYETLVTEPGPTISKICSFLDINYDPSLLDPERHARHSASYGTRDYHKRIGQPISPKSIGSWTGTLSKNEDHILTERCLAIFAKVGCEIIGQ